MIRRIFRKGGWLVFLLILSPASVQADTVPSADAGTAPPLTDAKGLRPVGKITVTAEHIRRSATGNLADFLDSLAGISVTRQHGLYGSHSRIEMLGGGISDPRGVLLLLNGQPFDAAGETAVDLAAIPPEAIERIDILPGTGATRYGANATYGVIDIRIRQAAQPGAGAGVTGGSYQSQAVDGWAALGNLQSGLWAAGLTLTSDGYRHNDTQERQQGLVHMTQDMGQWRTHALLISDDQTSELPGSRLVDRRNRIDQIRDDPRGASSTDDELAQRRWRLQPGIEVTTGIADLSLNATLSEATYQLSGSDTLLRSEVESYSLNPAARGSFSTGPAAHWWTWGLNLAEDQLHVTGNNTTDDGNMLTHSDSRRQRTGIFVQHSTRLHSKVILSLGARRERVQTRIRQQKDTITPASARQRDYLTTGEAGLRWTLAPGLDTFFNSARTARLADLNRMDVLTTSLEPERGWLHTAGLGWQDAHQYSVMTAWQSDQQDEIRIHPDTGSLTNLSGDTRRRGISLTSRFLLDEQVAFVGGFTFQSAEFSSGVRDGKHLPGVPEKTARVEIDWEIAAGLRLAVAQRYAGERYYPGDDDNTLGKRIPAYTWTNLMISATAERLHWSLGAFNLQDRLVWESGFADPTTGQYSAMPLPGRHYLLTARVSF